SPRISAAWDVTGKGRTVLRAGYGLLFDAFSQDMMLGHLPYPTFYAPGPAYNPIGPNPVQMANINPAALDPNGVYIPNTPLYGFPNGAFYIFQENSTGKSNYNSLQTSLHVTNYHGFMSIVNYVWSKSLDNSSDGEDFVVNAAQPQDSNSPQREYGLSNFDIRHRFTWIMSYELPKTSGSMQKLRNGWGADSTITLQSGQPFTLNYNFEDDYSGGGD